MRIARLNQLLDLLCGLLSGIALFAIMMLAFFDMLGRKFASHSITGSPELTELLMVAVIFGALPLVSRRGEHAESASLAPCLPAWLRRAQAVFAHLLCAVLLLGLAVLMWHTGTQFLATAETTAQLQILKAPFLYGVAVLCGLAGVVHLALLREPPRQRPDGEKVAP